MIKRLDATFDPKDDGYASFAKMVNALDAVVEIKKGGTDHTRRIRKGAVRPRGSQHGVGRHLDNY